MRRDAGPDTIRAPRTEPRPSPSPGPSPHGGPQDGTQAERHLEAIAISVWSWPVNSEDWIFARGALFAAEYLFSDGDKTNLDNLNLLRKIALEHELRMRQQEARRVPDIGPALEHAGIERPAWLLGMGLILIGWSGFCAWIGYAIA